MVNMGKGKEGKKRGEKREKRKQSFRGVTLGCAIVVDVHSRKEEKKREKKENLARKLRLLTNCNCNFRYGKG